MSLLLNTVETRKTFIDTRTRVSWSKWKDVKLCPARWFATNFAVWDHPQTVQQDSLRAVPGTIVQRVWEAFINGRVYSALPYTQEAWIDWLDQSTRFLYHLTVKPRSAQFEPPYSLSPLRGFFRTKAGKHQVKEAIEAGMPQGFTTGLKLSFVDPQEFQDLYGSEEKFFLYLRDTYVKTLTLFAQHGVNLDAILSEQYIESTILPTTACGSVDFFVQPGPVTTPFRDFSRLQDGYTLLDGKIRFCRTLDQEQLFFYAAIVQYRYRRTAQNVGFINWSQGAFSIFPYIPSYANRLKTGLQKLYDDYTPLESVLSNTSSPTIELSQLPYLKFTPGPVNCAYCPIQVRCASAQSAGISSKPQSLNPSDLDFSQFNITDTSQSHDLDLQRFYISPNFDNPTTLNNDPEQRP